MNTSKTGMVILGAGIMQLPAIKAVLQKGFEVIVFDGSPDAPGRILSGRYEIIDLKDKEKILEKCLEIRKSVEIKGVFTAGTDFSFTAAWLAEKLGLPGISYRTSLKATDKGLMRKTFADNSIPSPDYIATENISNVQEKVNKLGFPLVVKPVDSMGARGTVMVKNPGELEDAFKISLKYSRTGKAVIEQYIEGPEFSLDALTVNGKIHICGIADRHICFPPYFIEMGHTMPSSMPEEIIDQVAETFKKGIKAIGINCGAAKGDIKYSEGKAVAGEIAARLSGGYMSGWTFPYSTGFSVTAAAVDIAAGIEPEIPEFTYSKVSAERAFISIPGIVDSVVLPDYISGNGECTCCGTIKNCFVNVKQGQEVCFPKNNVEKCGNVISADSNREKAVSAAEKACRDIFVKLVPGHEITRQFLFGDREKEKWIPEAFHLADKKNIEALKRMPEYSGNLYLMYGKKDIASQMKVFVLPYIEAETSLDWQGRNLSEAFRQIAGYTGVSAVSFCSEETLPEQLVLGSSFWKSVVLGSVQGGVWYIETVVNMVLKGMDIRISSGF